MGEDDQYLETEVMTASPYRLHLLAVDGAIRSALRAAEALKGKDFESAHLALNNSRGFVAELISGLNPEHAPETVEKLKGVFGFVFRNLAEADLQHDTKLIADAVRVLRVHRDTWAALADKLEPQTASDSQPLEGRSWTS